MPINPHKKSESEHQMGKFKYRKVQLYILGSSHQLPYPLILKQFVWNVFRYFVWKLLVQTRKISRNKVCLRFLLKGLPYQLSKPVTFGVCHQISTKFTRKLPVANQTVQTKTLVSERKPIHASRNVHTIRTLANFTSVDTVYRHWY